MPALCMLYNCARERLILSQIPCMQQEAKESFQSSLHNNSPILAEEMVSTDANNNIKEIRIANFQFSIFSHPV